MLVYEYVLGTSEALPKEKLERNKERFTLLPENEKALILNDYNDIQKYAGRPIFIKIMDGLKKLFFVPLFKLAWISYAIIISILLLLKTEGAKQAAWLLPFLVLVYSIDNRISGHSAKPGIDSLLFPQESEIIMNYLDEPFSGTLFTQKAQLQNGWENYLIANWLPSGTSTSLQREQKIEAAEFVFTKIRLLHYHKEPMIQPLKISKDYIPWPLVFLYLFWNIFFAFRMNVDYNRSDAPEVLQFGRPAAQNSG